MNEQLQGLASPAGRSSLTLQIRTFDVPPAARGQLCTILRFGPDGEAARQGAACIGQLHNDPPPDGGKQGRPHRLALPMPVTVSLSPGRCKELTPKTTESHWSGGQREP
jgi:hypothetical protein